MIRNRRNNGFTLIEVLVAISIFAMLSIFSVQGFLLVANMEQRNREEVATEQAFHRVWSLIGQDLLHIRQRPIHDQFGVVSGAYIAGRDPYLVEFTRGGLPSVSVAPGGMMRIAYRLSDEGELIRTTWSALDTPDIDDFQERVIMTGLVEAQFEQLNDSNYFESLWPPLNAQGETANIMPRMIRVTLETMDGLALTRLMPGLTTVGAIAPGDGNGGGNEGNGGDGGRG
ncbi:unnamed protein product [marine sediment metagenome]|uniref:Type II secretion system protein J n=1 Tax=marine sediment metagenome TaxID=412755 RepID=X0TM82_9ZZZZ